MTEEQAAKILRQGSKMAWDAEEFCEAYDMGIKALERQSGEDCVSRANLIDKLEILDKRYGSDFYWEIRKIVDSLPPVTPTHCIAVVRFSKEDLREICNERIEIACEHGTCKDCKHNKMSHNSITLCYTKCDLGHRFELREPSTFYCADFEKRGSENE